VDAVHAAVAATNLYITASNRHHPLKEI
jgi:hypothetical protein